MDDTVIAPGGTTAGHCADAHVPRALVHKAADREVLLSAVRPLGGDRFAVLVRWPHDHLLHHRAADGTRDSLVVVETMRQAGICLSHRFHGVPADHMFVLHGFDFHLDAPLRDSGDGADVSFHVTVRRVPGSPRRFRLTSEADLLIDGRTVGRASMRWDALPPAQYALVRSRSAAAAAPFDVTDLTVEARTLSPAAVGRDHDDAVLLASLGDASAGWQLRPDTGHPALFDHASDHIPGMVIVEGFRQAVLVRAAEDTPGAWAIDSLQASFLSFGELGQPVTITAAPEGAGAYLLAARQGTRTLATALAARSAASPLDGLLAGVGAAAC
ncbi:MULTISPECIES: ScbA/BarX family gamma-butyrolactone biosynthesis protein [Streptomyces]|uniref:ScbA/BarX family gamma-butyrolactone biosynthesis protein n=1 Tax=Streptomyces TaxID=1883 RepID=UPI0029AC8FE9|nr:ScbA/BarX family gamma-butyrolactone biosynthesis protein [Streptomyces sp. WI03-4A]MDX2590856.1 ScbA/BarX family gamma-butyrolactone biosynthesis protein [Streptomyces sp. WI03-4A]